MTNPRTSSSTCDFVTKRNYRHFHVISQLTIDMSNIVYRHYLCEIITVIGLSLDLIGKASMAFLNQYTFFLTFYFYFILVYNTVLVLPYIDMNPPRVYMGSQTWTPLPLPSSQHPSGSSQCTSPKHAVSCIRHRLEIRFLHDSIHVRIPILPNRPTLSLCIPF